MTTIAQEVEKLWEHNRTMFPTPPRRVQVQKAGAFRKVRYEGSPDFVFSVGETLAQHTRMLKYFGL